MGYCFRISVAKGAVWGGVRDKLSNDRVCFHCPTNNLIMKPFNFVIVKYSSS